MKNNWFFLSAIIIVGTMMLPGCKPTTEHVIGADAVEIKDGYLSPEALWAMGRLGEVAPSPSGKYIAYSVRFFSVKENKGNTDLYIMDVDGSNLKRLTFTNESEGNIVWGKDDQSMYFLKSGKIVRMDPTEEKPKVYEVSAEKEYIEGFRLSPDGKNIAYIKQIQVKPYASDLYQDLDKTTGMVFNDMNYRHWDEWVYTAPHIFVASLQNNKMAKGKDILEGEPYEAPVKPFGGTEQFSWSPDGETIAYTSRKLTGLEYALSTNTDIYTYNLKSGQTSNISNGMKGYDLNPTFSPSGEYIAWESMRREGYEADKIRMVVMNVKTGEKLDVSYNFDQNVSSLAWNKDGNMIYFISNQNALSQIYVANLKGILGEKFEGNTVSEDGLIEIQSPIKMLTTGRHDYIAVMPVSDSLLIGALMSMSMPSEIFSVAINDNEQVEQKQISHINDHILSQIKMGNIEERWIKTTDGKQMLTWVIFPPNFDPNKTYPTLLYCQGGPQSTVSQFWSFRWNFQIMAANNYIIVAPNRRGLPGFGQEWNEQISGDYAGQNMKDYLSAIDAISKEPYVDKDRRGCVGASYGGFSVYWLAGHHDKRFKGFIAHDGMFNLEQQYLETEELWFTNWDLGGAYWDKSAAIQKTYANSPHKFVDKWDAPIMIIHGEKDFRIVASQGMAAFNAALLRGVQAELLIFPDENHWVLSPQNGILWQRRFFRFLDKHVKALSEKELQKQHHRVSTENVMGSEKTTFSNKEVNTETQVAQ